MAGADIDERRRKPGETNLQWEDRIARLDTDMRDRSGPLITPETERHGSYTDAFIMHVETYTLARTRRNETASPIETLHRRGGITAEQLEAAEQIEMITHMIGGDVSVRGASLEARVDNSGSGRDMLIEGLGRVWLEVSYTRWRQRISPPKQMVLDMITGLEPLASVANRYRMGWPRARRLLEDSLDIWIEIRHGVARAIDEEDVSAIHKRLGGGVVR